MADMDWSEMEGLFCQQAPPSAQSSPKLGNRDSVDHIDRRMRKDSSEVRVCYIFVIILINCHLCVSDYTFGW